MKHKASLPPRALTRSLLAVLLAACLNGCSEHAWTAPSYRNSWHRFLVSFGLDERLEVPPCFRVVEFGIQHVGEEACFRFGPPARMQGVWLPEFEGSSFFQNARVRPTRDFSRSQTWLDLDSRVVLPKLGVRDDGELKAVAVDFVGRRSIFPGMYGHLGGSRHYIIVDRLISAKLLPDPA